MATCQHFDTLFVNITLVGHHMISPLDDSTDNIATFGSCWLFLATNGTIGDATQQKRKNGLKITNS
jgi:hypothetical protein